MTDTDSDGGHPLDSYLEERSAKRQRVSPAQPKKRAASTAQSDSEPSPNSASEQEGEAQERRRTQLSEGGGAGLDNSKKARKRAAKKRRAAEAAAAAAAAEVIILSSGSDSDGGVDDDDVVVVGLTAAEGGEPAGQPPGSVPSSTARHQPSPKTGAVVGVVVVEDAQEIVRDFEVAKLLRNPRYFDDFAEAPTAKAFRCFHCGQVGHAARDCTNQARVKPCYLCAHFGHDGRDCPNKLCYKCGRPGHIARECPTATTTIAAAAGKPCLRCGRADCEAAGKGDYYRYEGGCRRQYLSRDLQLVRCMSCGDHGHLMCKPTPKESATPSCYNCGRLGHYGEVCPSGTRPHLVAERRGDEGRMIAELEAYEATLERDYQMRAAESYGGGGGAGSSGRSNGYNQQPYNGRAGGGGDYRAQGYQYPTQQQQQQYGSYGGGQQNYGGQGGYFDRSYSGGKADDAYRGGGYGGGTPRGGGGGGGRERDQYDQRRTKTPRW